VQVTGYTVHTGSTEDFSNGWDRIFGEKTVKKEKKQKKAKKKTAAKKESKKKKK
jgi:sterol desaturase/sphingolipid hydroxylase (fatty acid hydroxylase superfamily)|tara:strand:- start:600 stop:761 length:162 start_codon:yes stop_codon:yes gene_type:complete